VTAAGLAQPLGISAPRTAAQLPFPLWVNGNEISQGASGADALSYKLRDPGFSGPSTFQFKIYDRALTVRPWLAKQQRVIWYDAVNDRYLFQGYVTDIRSRTVATWVELTVTCMDMSVALDTGIPITTWENGYRRPSDQSMIGSLLGNFSQELQLGSGGFIQVLNGNMPGSIPSDRTTLRNAIQQVLSASGVLGAVCYVDSLGFLHTLAIGDVNAPYAISDTPNYATTIPAHIEVIDQGAADVDALMVYGATALGSGPTYAWQCGITTPPRSPLRWATLDAPHATDRTGRIAAATVEFQRRQNALAVTLVVSGDSVHGNFDGWAKGQLLTITNGPLGYAGKQLTISAVDMEVISGKGDRRYTLTAGADPIRFSARVRILAAQATKVAVSASAVRGKLGGA
jgi:hypothetical protein